MRTRETTMDVIVSYFKELWTAVKRVDCRLMFNFDETTLEFKQNRFRVVAPRESASGIVRRDVHEALHISLGATICADGTAMKPVVCLPVDNLRSIPAVLRSRFWWCGSAASRGWMNGQMFRQWLLADFLPQVKEKWYRLHFSPLTPISDGESEKDRGMRPLLIFDGLCSHTCWDTQRLLKQGGVRSLVLPPHTSHVTQPLDNGVFLAFKRECRKAQGPIMSAVGRRAKMHAMLVAAADAVDVATDRKTIALAWRTTGIFPWNPQRVFRSPFVRGDIPTETAEWLKWTWEEPNPGTVRSIYLVDQIISPAEVEQRLIPLGEDEEEEVCE